MDSSYDYDIMYDIILQKILLCIYFRFQEKIQLFFPIHK